MCRSALRSSTARNSARLRSVMSMATPTSCWPSFFSARPRAAIQRTSPSAATTRYSTSISSPVASAFLTARSSSPRSPGCAAFEDVLESDRRVGAGLTRTRVRRNLVAGHVPDPRGKPCRARRQIHPPLGFLQGCRDAALRSTFNEKRRNQPGLKHQDRNADGNLAPVPVPCGRFAKPHVGIAGQQVLVDSPTAKCAPVDHGHVDERGRGDRRWRRAVQQAHHEGAGLGRLVVVGGHIAADYAGAYERIERPIDRRRGR